MQKIRLYRYCFAICVACSGVHLTEYMSTYISTFSFIYSADRAFFPLTCRNMNTIIKLAFLLFPLSFYVLTVKSTNSTAPFSLMGFSGESNQIDKIWFMKDTSFFLYEQNCMPMLVFAIEYKDVSLKPSIFPGNWMRTTGESELLQRIHIFLHTGIQKNE